ncbi:hypothetical protein K2173_016646 [Erythroxylum novogranatense]|uniref:1,3-beta-glucan synthase n=1 Tax=Erythroxylum novogranatense TaxID=1862640 RepID=A0AAV8SS10_9ROSI|nr:hypothetical protein K2173_016646 [Erythroxylum novogranatense]
MSSEIVLADPIVEPITNHHAITWSHTFADDGSRDHQVHGGDGPEPFDSERLPPTLARDIQRFLRVANLVQTEEPRIAYLCRFHAFEIAHNLDRNSSGRGVRQFKTALLQRLEYDEDITLRRRKEKSDERELKRVYHAYRDYIIRSGGGFDLENSHTEKLINARRIATVLFEVLKTVTDAAGPQALADRNSIHVKPFYVPYNILPLDQGAIQQAIMQLPEIKAAVAAVYNTRGLPSVEDFIKGRTSIDLFEFLQCSFGFQEGNIANQREHLILLIANTHIRQSYKQSSISKLGDEALDVLMKKFFKNYTDWCKFLGRKSNIRLPYVRQEAQQYKILYIGLYLLIWGEAANLRLMPECLCYIFHHMANELHGMLTGAVSLTTGEKVMPAYRGGHESFLNNVVTPIYKVIRKEAEKNKSGAAEHSTWRNYDDINEYFWSPDCFQIGWPMRLNHDFFFTKSSTRSKVKTNIEGKRKRELKEGDTEMKSDEELGDTVGELREPKWLGKTNFVEIRSFWQIFRSFDRMWSFFILSLQAMIIMACHDLGSPLEMFDAMIFEDILSIFITSAILKLMQAILDIVFTWKARLTMDIFEKRKQVLKLVVAVIWTVILPIYYVKTRRKYTCYSTKPGSWQGELCLSSFMIAVSVYLILDAVEMVLFFVPVVSKYIETSNWHMLKILSWWTQPRLYVGRGMQETQVSIFKYTLFWILVLSSKFLFSYSFEIKPLIGPTRTILKIGVQIYDWHELFPKVKSNAGAIVAIWSPIIVVYFMDTQIWYSVFCTVFGGVYGILHHLGEIRTLGMLRIRFHTLPSAFNFRLVPPSFQKDQKKTRSFIHKESVNGSNNVAKFVLVWNQIINTFRAEDLISNWELDLMVIPLSPELFSGMVRWPIFLLANKFSTALSIARDFVGKGDSLFKKIKKDKYMYSAVKECYESLKDILEILVVGDQEKRVISILLTEIEESLSRPSLLEDLKLSELPALQAKCKELLELLVEGSESHRDNVVRVLQDMFEIVTIDIMRNSSRTLDLFYSSQHIEENFMYFNRNIRPQLFESTGDKNSIHFPLPDSDPLKEQIKRLLLILTVKDKAMDIPENLEARRRISFFATSLFTDMPIAPEVRNMLSFSVLTPHFMEDIKYSMKELHSSKEEVSILFYMKKIYPDEWKNFLERMGCEELDGFDNESNNELLRDWASFRGQTLSRTVRGIMYYREALRIQAFLDMAEDEDILEGYDAAERNNRALFAQIDALSDMKFTYIISWQAFGSRKSSGDPHAKDVLELLTRYPSVRVAYVEEKEVIVNTEPQKVYSSILVKGVNGYDQEVYRIKLPGPPNIGEGKPENQNHAIVFTRGEALQNIDMNQDNYLEEAFKMRNLLQEFLLQQGRRPPTILGLREHIFTGSVSSLAWFMSYQETSFVTIGQRILANPLR